MCSLREQNLPNFIDFRSTPGWSMHFFKGVDRGLRGSHATFYCLGRKMKLYSACTIFKGSGCFSCVFPKVGKGALLKYEGWLYNVMDDKKKKKKKK